MKAKRFILTFETEIEADKLTKAVKKLRLDGPVVCVTGNFIIEECSDGSIAIKRAPSPEEANIRRIIRDEIYRMGR